MRNPYHLLQPFNNQNGHISYSMPWFLGAPAWLLLLGFGLTFILMPAQF